MSRTRAHTFNDELRKSGAVLFLVFCLLFVHFHTILSLMVVVVVNREHFHFVCSRARLYLRSEKNTHKRHPRYILCDESNIHIINYTTLFYSRSTKI